MTAHTAEISAELPCHRCGYDLRAHPADGKCPECGESVAESRRMAAIPRRPAWRDSDPRWRRRMLAGVWILVLLPLIDALQAFAWASSIPVPTVFDFRAVHLDDTLLCYPGVYQPLVFCIGVVLLFSKERGKHRCRLYWMRRWGVVCTYVVLLLSAAQILFLGALVFAGTGAVFLSMPLKYQPPVTQWFVNLSGTYLRYGPCPHEISYAVLAAFSSTAVLLACIPLFDALRSSGPKPAAASLLAPLALFALMYVAQAGWYCLGFSSVYSIYSYEVYFCPQMALSYVPGFPTYLYLYMPSGPSLSTFLVEATKWCIILAIAVWLTIAQIASWRRHKEASAI